jgi:hypothetical protein
LPRLSWDRPATKNAPYYQIGARGATWTCCPSAPDAPANPILALEVLRQKPPWVNLCADYGLGAILMPSPSDEVDFDVWISGPDL